MRKFLVTLIASVLVFSFIASMFLTAYYGKFVIMGMIISLAYGIGITIGIYADEITEWIDK